MGNGQRSQRKTVVAEVNQKSSGYQAMAGALGTAENRTAGNKNTRVRNVAFRRQAPKGKIGKAINAMRQ